MNHQPRIVVLITQNQSYRFLEINHYTFSSVMIIHYVSLFSNAIRFSSWKTRHGQTPSHPVRHSVFKERVLNDKWEEKSWKSIAERRKSERHVDWQGEEGAGRRENAFERSSSIFFLSKKKLRRHSGETMLLTLSISFDNDLQ